MLASPSSPIARTQRTDVETATPCSHVLPFSRASAPFGRAEVTAIFPALISPLLALVSLASAARMNAGATVIRYTSTRRTEPSSPPFFALVSSRTPPRSSNLLPCEMVSSRALATRVDGASWPSAMAHAVWASLQSCKG